MNKFEIIKREWRKSFNEMNQSKGFKLVGKGEMTMNHYIGFLKQMYLQVRENGSLQASCTNRFKGEQRKMTKMFMKHALSEVGHEELILDDLKALGVETAGIECERPLPAVSALVTFPYYLINHENPVAYLGFVFHLEFMPTMMGWNYIEGLKRAGIPEAATSFIAEHAEVDEAHNKLMERYIENLVQTEQDLDDVIYAAKMAAHYYGAAVAEIIEAVDQGTLAWGVNRSESFLAHKQRISLSA